MTKLTMRKRPYREIPLEITSTQVCLIYLNTWSRKWEETTTTTVNSTTVWYIHIIAHSHGHSHVALLFKVTRPFCCVTLLRIPEESYRSAMRTWNLLWICCSSPRKTLERFMSKVFNPFQITFLLAFFTNFIHSKKKFHSLINNLTLFCFAF